MLLPLLISKNLPQESPVTKDNVQQRAKSWERHGKQKGSVAQVLRKKWKEGAPAWVLYPENTLLTYPETVEAMDLVCSLLGI